MIINIIALQFYCRKYSCSLSHRIHSKCKVTLCWSSPKECHTFGMWCIWCTTTCEQVKPGPDHVPFHQRIYCFGNVSMTSYSYLTIYLLFCFFCNSNHLLLVTTSGSWHRGRYKGATGNFFGLFWCSIYYVTPYKVCSNARWKDAETWCYWVAC